MKLKQTNKSLSANRISALRQESRHNSNYFLLFHEWVKVHVHNGEPNRGQD